MIYGDGVRLRAIEREDIPTFVRWFNDPEIRDYLLMYTPMSLADEERWFESLADRTDDFLHSPSRRSSTTSGSTSATSVCTTSTGRTAIRTFGIALGEKQYWSQGYGTKATKTVLRYAFHELNLHRVELEVFAYNPRAIRCYEKAGFRHEGTRRQSHFHDGQYHDAYRMGILREEFEG